MDFFLHHIYAVLYKWTREDSDGLCANTVYIILCKGLEHLWTSVSSEWPGSCSYRFQHCTWNILFLLDGEFTLIHVIKLWAVYTFSLYVKLCVLHINNIFCFKVSKGWACSCVVAHLLPSSISSIQITELCVKKVHSISSYLERGRTLVMYTKT